MDSPFGVKGPPHASRPVRAQKGEQHAGPYPTYVGPAPVVLASGERRGCPLRFEPPVLVVLRQVADHRPSTFRFDPSVERAMGPGCDTQARTIAGLAAARSHAPTANSAPCRSRGYARFLSGC